MLSRLRAWWLFRQSVAAARAARPSRELHAQQGPCGQDPAGGRDIVLLPCWRRPEFLWHCLDNLTRAEGIAALHVVLRPDTGFAADTLEVIRAFADRLASFEIQFPTPCPYRRSKQSANVLLGYLLAAAAARQYVFMIEEDVMVARDFFRWHRAVQASSTELFCSIGVRNPNRRLALPDDTEGYYLSSGDYCSLGVCFDKRILHRLVAPHVNMAYLRRPKSYIRRRFRASVVAAGFTEQDGLLRRIQEGSGLSIAYPCLPRAYHAGFYGYHRPGGLDGPLAERVRSLAQIIYSTEGMSKAALRPEYIEDSVPVNLQPPPWRVQRQMPVPGQVGVPGLN
jgi:hypothetical protein